MVVRERTRVRRWRILTVLDSLNARFYVYVPFELENLVMVLLYYSKSFVHDYDIELSKWISSRLIIVEGTHRSQGTIATVAKRLAPL
jgi:hypothetical protein